MDLKIVFSSKIELIKLYNIVLHHIYVMVALSYKIQLKTCSHTFFIHFTMESDVEVTF